MRSQGHCWENTSSTILILLVVSREGGHDHFGINGYGHDNIGINFFRFCGNIINCTMKDMDFRRKEKVNFHRTMTNKEFFCCR
jgi:hypothetical protein